MCLKYGVPTISDPERFVLIRAAWDRLLTGAYSVPEIVDKLNDEWGYTTRPSKRTTPGTRRHGGGPLSLPSAYKLFHNPYYTGYFVVRGKTYKGQHPPMITAVEFSRVQELLARGGGRRRHKYYFAYSALLECARCGCRVTAEVQSGKYKPGRYVYYHCTNRLGGCTKIGIREELLEKQIETLLSSITIGQEVADYALAAVDKWQGGLSSEGERIGIQQSTSLAETERQISELLDLRLRGTIPDDLFEKKQSELQQRASKLRLSSRDTAQELTRIQTSARSAIRFMHGAQALFQVGTTEEKHVIARALGLRYVFDQGEVTIDINPALPPHLLLTPEFPEPTSTEHDPKKGPKKAVSN